MICSKCGAETQKPIEHHVSYKPEITISVCRKCHGKLHAEDISKGQKCSHQLKREGLRHNFLLNL